jgi:hypothetical protein
VHIKTYVSSAGEEGTVELSPAGRGEGARRIELRSSAFQGVPVPQALILAHSPERSVPEMTSPRGRVLPHSALLALRVPLELVTSTRSLLASLV